MIFRVIEFYGIIHIIEQVRKKRQFLLIYALNVIMYEFVLHRLILKCFLRSDFKNKNLLFHMTLKILKADKKNLKYCKKICFVKLDF